MTIPPHPSGIKPSVVEKVLARRGRLHAFPTLDPGRTALVVVDLDTGTVSRVEAIRAFLPRVTRLARSLRDRGGTVVWVTTPAGQASRNFRAVYGDEMARMHEQEAAEGTSSELWGELEPAPDDVFASKRGSSAFFPGKCDLHERLRERDVRSVLIVGAVTNVCCESSARDAAELDYEVTMVSDCLWGHKDGQHEATLATFFRNYGDVRPSAQLIELMTSNLLSGDREPR